MAAGIQFDGERLRYARGINDLAQEFAEKHQRTEQALHLSFDRARRVKEVLASERDASAGDIATTLLYVASDYLWCTPWEFQQLLVESMSVEN